MNVIKDGIELIPLVGYATTAIDLAAEVKASQSQRVMNLICRSTGQGVPYAD